MQSSILNLNRRENIKKEFAFFWPYFAVRVVISGLWRGNISWSMSEKITHEQKINSLSI